MENSKINPLLIQAAQEIKSLRRVNEIQTARLQMFDACMALFKAEPPRYGCSHSPDVLQDLEKQIAENNAAIQTSK